MYKIIINLHNFTLFNDAVQHLVLFSTSKDPSNIDFIAPSDEGRQSCANLRDQIKEGNCKNWSMTK